MSKLYNATRRDSITASGLYKNEGTYTFQRNIEDNFNVCD